MNQHKQACELGEAALSDALEKIDDVDEETFRDAKSIIELLKENLSLWKEEEEQNAVEDLWASRHSPCAVKVWCHSPMLSILCNETAQLWLPRCCFYTPEVSSYVITIKLFVFVKPLKI